MKTARELLGAASSCIDFTVYGYIAMARPMANYSAFKQHQN